MSQFDFQPIYDQYPAIINIMDDVFTSHQFILKLAQANQFLYVEALYAYRNNLHREQSAPFLMVHKELAKGLARSELVVHIGTVSSHDIFGKANDCGQWRKIAQE